MENRSEKKIFIIIALIFISITSANAQIDTRTQNQIKAKFLNAQELYDEKDYSGSLEKVYEIEKLTNGQLLAAAQNLKVKCLVGQKMYSKANKELYTLEGLNLSSNILNDIADYKSVIEKNIEAEKKEVERKKNEAIYNKEKKERLDLKKKKEKLEIEQTISATLSALEKNNYNWSKNHNLAIIESSDVNVYSDKTYGLINKNGEIKVPIKYDKIVLEENIVYVMNNPGYVGEEMFIFNLESEALNSTKYDDLISFGDKILIFENENSFKIINTKLKNNVIYESEKKTRNRFSVGVDVDYDLDIISITGAYKDNFDFTTFGIINKKGKFIVPIGRYYEIGKYNSKGLAEINKNGKLGLIDLSGKEIVSPKYIYIWAFIDDLCLVQGTNERWGYINENGVEVLPTIYYSAEHFNNGTAFVRFEKGKKLKKINKQGKKVRK